MPEATKLLLVSCACWMVMLVWMVKPRCVGCEVIIIRKVNMKDVYHKDRFNIPRSKCTEIRQGNKCAVYGGFERSPNNPCKCQCPPLMGTIAQQIHHRWKCTGNAELRQREDHVSSSWEYDSLFEAHPVNVSSQALPRNKETIPKGMTRDLKWEKITPKVKMSFTEGCGFYFPYESSKSFIKMLLPNQWQFIHTASSGCRLHGLNSSYLACNGSWVTSPSLARNIDVISRGFDQVARGYAYQVRVRKNSCVSGKMIKLSLTCSPFGGKPCLLLKMRGNQNCVFRKRTANRKKFRKNEKAAKGLSSLLITPSLSSQSLDLVGGGPRLSSVRGKSTRPIDTNRKKDESRAEKIRRDEGVTTIILIFAACLLGAMIVVLTINLFFCSSDQETYKAKHIFRGRKNRRLSEESMPRARAPSNASTHSSNFTTNNKLSLQDSCLCTNKITRSSNSSNKKLSRQSTDKIEDSTQNSQASLQTSHEIRDIELAGDNVSSLNGHSKGWINT